MFQFDRSKNVISAEGEVIIDDTLKNIKIFSDSAYFYKNENIFKTKNNSKAVDGSVTIEAQDFTYKRNKEILNAKNKVKIRDTYKNYTVFGNNITYFKFDDKIFSKGLTDINLNSEYKFISKDVTILRSKNEIFSSEKTTIDDNKFTRYQLNKFRFFENSKKLIGEDILVITNYTKPKSDKFFFSDGIFDLQNNKFAAKNTKILLHKNLFDEERLVGTTSEEKELERKKRFNNKNDPRIYSVSSSGDDDITTLNKAIFTSCGFNKDCPAWSIKSNKILHDKKKKNIIYEDAVLNIYDYPVFYFPKFFHPDPSVKRRSGFLQPTLNNSNIVGTSINLPYFHVISENQDLTFKPTIFDDRIYMFQNEYRLENEKSSFIADFGYTKGYQSKLSNNRNGMSHLFSKLNIDLDFKNFNESKLDFFLEKVSMDTYLSIFDGVLLTDKTFEEDIKDHSTLTSGFKLALDHDDFTFNGGMYAYESLQTKKNNDRFEYVLPYYDFSTTLFSNDKWTLGLSSNGKNVLSKTNQLKSSVTNNINYTSNDFVSSFGFVNNIGVYLRNSNFLGKNVPNYRSSPRSEILNIYELKSELPLIKEGNNRTEFITPKVSFRINPSDMKDYNGNKSIITTDNVFGIDRYGFSDSFESGKSLTIGMDYRIEKKNDKDKYLEFKLANIIRDTPEYKIPRSSSAQGKMSNIFGSIENKFTDNLKFDYKFSLDNNLKNIEYSDFSTEISINNFVTEFSFKEENGETGDTNYIENTSSINFDENNSLKFKTRRNRKISLTEYYDLVYQYEIDCLTAGIKYRKTYYQDRDLTPKEDLFFTITLFPLASLDQKIDKNVYRDKNNNVIWK